MSPWQCTFENFTGNSQTETDNKNNVLVLLVFLISVKEVQSVRGLSQWKTCWNLDSKEGSWERLWQLQQTQTKITGLHNIRKRWVLSKWKNTLDFLLLN